MKSTKTKLLAGIGIIGLGTVLLSFGNPQKTGEPKMTRIEVIRSVNGEVKTYDTLVATSSGFTAEQYLELLGFSADENIQIMNMPFSHAEMVGGQSKCDITHGDSLKVVRVVVDENGTHRTAEGDQVILMGQPGFVICDSAKMVDIRIDGKDLNFEGHPGQMKIEKNIVIKTIDSTGQEMMETQHLIELINLDSLVQLHTTGLHDSMMVIMHKVVVEDGQVITDEYSKQPDWEKMNGEPSFERHLQNGNTKSDMMVFSGGEDFTIVIVSDATAEPKKEQVKIEKTGAPAGTLKLYPNPSSKEVTVQLNFDEKASTSITVTDAQGKNVMLLTLGDFAGEHIETINISRWPKGIYFVTVDRPGVKMVEKLVVE